MGSAGTRKGEATRRLGVATKLAYGLGQAAEGFKNTSFSFFLLFYYVQVLGLPAPLGGAALVIALLFDAATDPIAGHFSDNWKSRLGRRHPFMYISAVPVSIAFYFAFAPPEGLGEWGLFAWLTGVTVLTRAGMTFFHVPHMALGAELSEDHKERTVLVSYRMGFSIAGGILTYSAFVVFFTEGPNGVAGQLVSSNYPPFALTGAFLMLLTILLCTYGTQSQIPYLLQPSPQAEKPRLVQVFVEFWRAAKVHSYRILLLAVLSDAVMLGAQYSLTLFLYTFFFELESSPLLWVMLAGSAGMLAGAFLTPFLNERFERRTVALGGVLWFAIFTGLPPILRLLEMFPANNSLLLYLALGSLGFMRGLGQVQNFVSINAMIADVADEYELETGRRQEGILFAGVSFTGKAPIGLGGLLASLGLHFIGWPEGESVTSASDIPRDTLFALGLLVGPIFGSISLLSAYLYWRYDLSRSRHAQILSELERSRSAEPSGSTSRADP